MTDYAHAHGNFPAAVLTAHILNIERGYAQQILI